MSVGDLHAQQRLYIEHYEDAYQRIQLIQRLIWLLSAFAGTCAVVITGFAVSSAWPTLSTPFLLTASWGICLSLWLGLGAMQMAAYTVQKAIQGMRRQIEHDQQLDELKDQFIASV